MRNWVNKLVIVVLVLLATGVILTLAIYDPPVYPLEFTAQQNVLREPPTFHLNESVNVEALFTNTTKQPVTFTAAIHWILVEPEAPTSTDIIQLGLLATIQPGCTELNFSNSPPEEVVAVTKQLFEKHKKVTWRLSGNNVVVVPKNSGQKQFDVDTFSYVPDDTPLPKFTTKHNNMNCEGSS